MREHADEIYPAPTAGTPAGSPAATPIVTESTASFDAALLTRQLEQCRAELVAKEGALQQARRALSECEARFRAMADSAPLMIWMTDADHQCVFINQAWQRFTGRSLFEERDDGWIENVHPDDRERCLATHHEAFASRSAFSTEYRLHRVDGQYRWLLDSAAPRYDADGAFLGYIGCCVDITDRHEAEEALQRRERYQRALLDNFPFLVWLKDPEGRFLAVNATLAQAFGVAHPDDLVGKTDFDITPAAFAEGYRADDRKVQHERCRLTVEEEIQKDGQNRWFETYKAPLLDAHGNILGTVGFARDVTERKDAEAALLRLKDTLEEKVAIRTAEAEARARALWESERFSRTTIDALPSALCVLDGVGQIVAVNKTWREFVLSNGCSPERMSEGANYLAICQEAAGLPPSSAVQVVAAIRAILTGDMDSFSFEYDCSTTVRQRCFVLNATPFPDRGPVRLLIKHDDITERKRLLDDQRENAARMKRLAAHLDLVREEQSTKISREIHDELGSTLTMLKLALATTADDPTAPAAMQARFGGMLEQIDAALQTVKRISASLRPATLDTLGLIATIGWYTRQFSQLTSIEVVLQMPEYVRLSPAANTAVFRIIQEGLTNVAKHARATRVDLTLHKQAGLLIVRLSDNGIGLASNSLSKRDSFGVIGMHERAQHLGGRLTLSGAPHAGTRLTLSIPLDSGGHHAERAPTW